MAGNIFADDLEKKGITEPAPASNPFAADLQAKGITDDAPAPALPETPESPKMGALEAAGHKVAQGAQLGFSDELQGVGGAAGELVYNLVKNGRLPTGKELRDAYTQTRDDERAKLAKASVDQPGVSTASEIAGGLLTPIPGLGGAATGAKAVGIGARALQAAKALAPAAATGAAYAVGAQDSGEGNIASPGELATEGAKGAATGAAAGAVVNGAANVGRKAYLWAGNKLHRGESEIKKAILDEIGTTSAGKAITPTAKKRLAKAGDAIYDELITGPDATVVQKAYRAKTAEEGLSHLKPVLSKLNAERDAAYDVFQKAGKGTVDVESEYVPKILAAAKEARIGAKKQLADGLEGIADMIKEEAKKTTEAGGVTDLKWLRGHTTAFQSAAASKLGGLNEHAAAKLANNIADDAKNVIGDVIAEKAKGNPSLEEVADGLQRLNRRIYANLAVRDALSARATKEATSGGPLKQVADKLIGLKHMASSSTGVLAGGAVGGPVGALVGGAAGLALPGAIAKADRALTTNGIERLREAAAGRGKVGPVETIKALAKEYGVNENRVRSMYVKMLLSGDEAMSKEATGAH